MSREKSNSPRRRTVVAFVETVSPGARMWRQFAPGRALVERVPRRFLRSEGGSYGEPREHYWCAADQPPTDDSFTLAPVFRTSVVPADAACETCGIKIRALQEMLS